MLTAILPLPKAYAQVECGWDCSGTTASCKSGGDYNWTGYCDDGSRGNCHEYCIGSINTDVNCGGVIQHISCNTFTKESNGCCLASSPVQPTNTPTPSPNATPTPTPGASPTPSTTPTPIPFCTQGKSIVLPPPPTITPTVTIAPTATPTVAPTAAPTGGANAGNLKFKVKLQGVEYANIASETNKTQKVKVTVLKQVADPANAANLETVLSKTFDNVDIHAQTPASGTIAIWQGEVAIPGVSAGDKYSILIKGPKHLQRKLCQNNPTERVEEGFPYRCLGTGQITLAASANDLDFSGVLLQAGDLPTQDGVVNARDVSVILNILKKGSSSEGADLTVGDIDLNGVVNAKDRSYLIETLEEKYGDEE